MILYVFALITLTMMFKCYLFFNLRNDFQIDIFFWPTIFGVLDFATDINNFNVTVFIFLG